MEKNSERVESWSFSSVSPSLAVFSPCDVQRRDGCLDRGSDATTESILTFQI